MARLIDVEFPKAISLAAKNFELLFLLIFLKILLSLFFIEFDECLLLKLILKLAFADPGITLSALLFILILV